MEKFVTFLCVLTTTACVRVRIAGKIDNVNTSRSRYLLSFNIVAEVDGLTGVDENEWCEWHKGNWKKIIRSHEVVSLIQKRVQSNIFWWKRNRNLHKHIHKFKHSKNSQISFSRPIDQTMWIKKLHSAFSIDDIFRKVLYIIKITIVNGMAKTATSAFRWFCGENISKRWLCYFHADRRTQGTPQCIFQNMSELSAFEYSISKQNNVQPQLFISLNRCIYYRVA